MTGVRSKLKMELYKPVVFCRAKADLFLEGVCLILSAETALGEMMGQLSSCGHCPLKPEPVFGSIWSFFLPKDDVFIISAHSSVQCLSLFLHLGLGGSTFHLALPRVTQS